MQQSQSALLEKELTYSSLTFLFPKITNFLSFRNHMYFTLSYKQRTINARKLESCFSWWDPKQNPAITHTLNSYVSYLNCSWSTCLCFLIKRSNLPHKYSEAANTTENQSTIISTSFYICLKQTKQNHWQDPKTPNITKDSTKLSKDQITCGSLKEQLIIQGQPYIIKK